MRLTHIILTREDGTRLELTVDEARQLWSQLGLVFAQPLPTAPTLPLTTPHPGYTWPLWTGDPLPAPFVGTCEARS